jgi:large subunit ribosomal protein L4e
MAQEDQKTDKAAAPKDHKVAKAADAPPKPLRPVKSKAAPVEAEKKAPAAAERKAPAKSQPAPKKPKKEKTEVKFPEYDDAGEHSGLKVPIFSEEGDEKRVVHLPKVFDEPVRTDLIARAVQAARANRQQPYGAPARGVWAGRRHSTEWSGKGKGVSRVQRLKDSMTGATSPNNVGGARAHPPRVVADRSEKINVKERRRARRGALAALSSTQLVRARGHEWEEKFKVPIIVESKFETLFRRAVDARDEEGRVNATKSLVTVLENLGMGPDLARARNGTHVRAGRGKMRGRRYRVPRSVLIVASNDKELSRAARNVPGVEVVSPKRLSTEALAPGGTPGRLALITESALAQLRDLR